jgi:hypothetical protein
MEATKTEILGEGALAEGSRTGKLGGRNVQSSDLNPLENAKTKMPAVVKAPREPEAQEQIASGRHSTTVATVPLTLSLNIIGQRKEPDGSYSEIIVREGSILRSHDKLSGTSGNQSPRVCLHSSLRQSGESKPAFSRP